MSEKKKDITFGEALKGEYGKKIQKDIENYNNSMFETVKAIWKHDAEKQAQPFLTNDLLTKLIKDQTPKWVNYLILLFSFIIVILTSVTILYTYGIKIHP